MANPANPGLQENWIGLRVPFPLANPKSGNTGTQEAWIGLRVDVPAYVAVVATGVSGASLGRAGARGIAAGVATLSSATAGRAGARAQCVGVKSTTAANASRSGARALTAGTTGEAHISAAIGSAGARAQSIGVKSVSVATTSCAGARGLSPGLSARTGTAFGRAGALGASVVSTGPITPRCPVTVRARLFRGVVPRRPLTLTVRNC